MPKIAPFASLSLIFAAAALVGVESPAAAAAVTPKVYAKASSKNAYINVTNVKIYGSVTGKSQNARIRLQRYYSGAWHNTQTSTVNLARTFSFTTKVPVAKGSFRAVVLATKYIKLKASSVVRVNGLELPDPAEVAAVRATILAKVNAARDANGHLPALKEDDPALDGVAQRWTQYMAATEDFRHNPNYATQIPSACTASAENIAAGQTPDQVVTAWMNSEGHRRNILNSAYTHIGIGYAYIANSKYGHYYTQNFCRK